jgi:hypothetical protein
MQAGIPVEVPAYDFTIHKRVGVEGVVANVSVVFLDGIFTVSSPAVRYGETTTARAPPSPVASRACVACRQGPV